MGIFKKRRQPKPFNPFDPKDFDQFLKSDLELPAHDIDQHRIYYWVKAGYKGKTIIRGPYNSEVEAYQRAFSELDGQFEVIALPTRDQSSATKMLRERILQDTRNMGNALSRKMHKAPQDYKRRWWKEE